VSLIERLFKQVQHDAEQGDEFAQEFLSIIDRLVSDFVQAMKTVYRELDEWDYYEQFTGDVE
jgi:hypothetical protein